MADEIIFVCELGAKKSVLAASWFAKLAAERGIRLTSAHRGVTPDPEVPARVREELLAHGIDIGDIAPRALSVEDWSRAKLVISFMEELVDAM